MTSTLMPIQTSSVDPAAAGWAQETDPRRAAELMVSCAQSIYRDQDARRQMNLRHAKLYFNRDLSSIYEAGLASDLYNGGVFLTLNVTQSCVDTLLAKISRSRPRVQFLTERGNHSLKRSAKQRTQFLDGVFHHNDLYNQDGRQVFRDATLFGSGLLQPYVTDQGEPLIDRILPDEIGADESEAIDGLKSLYNIFRQRWMHRDAVRAKWLPRIKSKDEKAAVELAIKSAGGAKRPGKTIYHSGAHQMIPVYSGWFRGFEPDGSDGRFIVAIEGAVLHSQVYKRKKFPFAWFHWNPAGAGLWGRSLAEQLVPIQIKINELIETIDEGQRLNCVPRIFVQEGMVNEDLLSNLVASVIPTSGPPGQVVQEHIGTGASGEMYSDLERWVKRAYEITGVSMLSATAEKPQGISSAVALRELLDREDMRFSPVGQNWERLFVDTGDLMVEAADEFYESARGKRLVVQVPGDKFIESIDWGAVDLPREKYILKASPTSTLPTTPAGKREYAIELYQAGGIDKRQFLEMLELPDTTSTVSLLTASLEVIERDIEMILEHGKYRTPEEFGDLQLAHDYAVMAYLRARNEEVPEERLEGMRRYIRDVQDLMGNAPEPGAGAPMVGGDPAAADPMAAGQPGGMPPVDPGMAPPPTAMGIESMPPQPALAAPA